MMISAQSVELTSLIFFSQHQSFFSPSYQNLPTDNNVSGDHLLFWHRFIFLASQRCYKLPQFLRSHILWIALFGNYSILCCIFVNVHSIICKFFLHAFNTTWFGSFLEYLLRNLAQQHGFQCDELFAQRLYFCIFYFPSITNQYLVFSLFHHGSYSYQFRELKFLGSVCLSQSKFEW